MGDPVRIIEKSEAERPNPVYRKSAPQSSSSVRSIAPLPQRTSLRQKVLAPTNIIFLMCGLLVVLGWKLPLHRYLTPKSGAGYALGIIGGCAMLILLLYPARKRLPWLGFMGSVKGWFETHMLLGVIGPVMILYHSNFSLGAVNSNVALICMLIVSGSGFIGRYFYTRIHFGLSEREATLADLQENATRLRKVSLSLDFMPELLERLDKEERQLLDRVERHLVIARPIFAVPYAFLARMRLNAYMHKALRQSAKRSPVIAKQRQRLSFAARRYIRDRIIAMRRVSEFKAYTSLFSLWHVLHLPLFFMLLVAGIVHVIAVHIY